MWSEEKIVDYLKKNLTEGRFIHTMGVCETAQKLAKLYDEDITSAKIAALLHDCTKNISTEKQLNICETEGEQLDTITLKNPALLHSITGAIFAKNTVGVESKSILDAIRFHTVGRENMTKLDKIIYLADYIEPNRVFNTVDELRYIAFNESLDKALLQAINNTIKYIVERKQLLHLNTIETRNWMLINGIK
ncbi:MAG: bis(5'-nucleosyl)-tetraphosphatase (symmetrical) YqeK [Clostridiaceae bacterium]